jgi:arginyl-tRNA--protein-N-Asp/Glu arginylyltransferase
MNFTAPQDWLDWLAIMLVAVAAIRIVLMRINPRRIATTAAPPAGDDVEPPAAEPILPITKDIETDEPDDACSKLLSEDASLHTEYCGHADATAFLITIPKSDLDADDAQALLENAFASYGGDEFTSYRCHGCSLCQPVRIDTSVLPSRRQRRAVDAAKLTLNVDESCTFTFLHAALLCRYKASRHDISEELIHDHLNCDVGLPFLINFLDPSGTLQGFVVVTRHGEALEANCHVYDPAYSQSTGTAMLTMLFELAAKNGLRYVYLGDTNYDRYAYKTRLSGAGTFSCYGWRAANTPAITWAAPVSEAA